MPTLTGRSGHLDVAMSDFATVAFETRDSQYIVDQLFPAIPVDKQSNKYFILDQRPFFTSPGDGALRAPRTQARKVEYSVSCDSYFAQNYALSHEFGVEELANLDRALLKEQNETKLLVNNLKLYQEIRVANKVTSISNIGSGVLLTGGNKWSDLVNSDPLGDVMSGQAFIRALTGLVPNVLMLDWDTHQVIKRHPVLLDMYKYVAGGTVTDEQMAAAFAVDKIIIAKAVKENQPEGAATSSLTSVWGNNALLAYVPGDGVPSIAEPCAGLYRFQWTSNDIYGQNFGVLRSQENGAGQRHVNIVETGHFQDEKIVARNLLYLIGNTL